MKVFVTGAAGFIGFHLAGRILDEGAEVVGFDNLNGYYDPALKRARLARLAGRKGFSFVAGDLANRAELSLALDHGPFHAVVNLAAQAGVRHSLEHPQSYVDSNLVGFANLLEECRRRAVAHLVYASSSSVYGLNSSVPLATHHNTDHPISLYAATKKANELMAHAYSHLFGLPTTGARFFTVYGPWGRPDMAYYRFTEAILADRPIAVFNRGELWRDFTYIDDVVESVFRLLARPPGGNPSWDSSAPDPATSSAPYAVYNIGNRRPVKLLDFIRILEGLLGRRARLAFEPMQAGDVVATCADTAGLEAAIGPGPSTELPAGLSRFVSWYRDYHRIDVAR